MNLFSPSLLALSLALLPAFVTAADRVALVIGNDAYQHARPLNAAVSDATAVADTLQKLGFETISASNAGLEQMIEAMETLKSKAAGAQAVLVYYAGHGIEAQGVNYLVPVDAKLEKEVQLQTQAVNLNTVLEKLTALNVPARMVILDCCRDNPLEGRSWLATRSAGGGGLGELPVQALPAATLVVYAASPGKPALDRVNEKDAHSPFTQALLDTLPEPGVHSFEVFGRVEESVLNRTEGRQSPRVFYNGSTLPFRNFRFAGTAVAVAVAPAPMTVIQSPPVTPAPAAEVAALKQQEQEQESQLQIATLQSKIWEYRRSEMHMVWDQKRSQGVVVLDKMPKVDSDKDYQLWVIDPSRPDPVSAGVVTVDAKGSVKASFKTVQAVTGEAKFALSVEKKGGVPKCEGQILMVGP